MFWDDLVRRVRREHRALDRQLLAAAGGNVAVLRTPAKRGRSAWVILVVALLVALSALLVLSGDVHAVFAAL